jgi:hypothetical protein
MPVADFAQGVTQSFPMVGQNVSWAQGKTAAKAFDGKLASGDAANGKSFLDNLLDIVNPLEHLPVIGTVYSELTGDKPGDFEQIAGDTLYGGPIGFVSSLASVGFEKLTGKDFGDTVWGWVTGNDKPTALAAAKTPGKTAATATGAQAEQAATKPPASLVPNTQSTTASQARVASGVPARLLNPLPRRGAPPASGLHTQPSEISRASALANLIARRQRLRAPAPTKSTQPAAQTPIASTAKPTSNSALVAQATTPDDASRKALLAAINQDGYGSELGRRALFAYQKTLAMGFDPGAITAAATQH